MELTPALKPSEEEEEYCGGDLDGLKKQLFCEDEGGDSLDVKDSPDSQKHKQPVLIYLRVRPKRPVEITERDPDCLHLSLIHI